MYIQTMTVTMTKQVIVKMNLSTGAPLPPSLIIYLFIYSFILFLFIDVICFSF